MRGFTRWNAADPGAGVDIAREPAPRRRSRARAARRTTPAAPCRRFSVAASGGRAAYVAGTFDTKGRELFYLRQCLEKLGLRVVTVDLSTSGKPSPASVHPREVARHHPQGERAVFTDDRGSAVSAMALAFEHFMLTRRDVGGIISRRWLRRHRAGHPRRCARLPIGLPKLMVSTVASRRHAALRRLLRHLHDVFGHRRAGLNRICERCWPMPRTRWRAWWSTAAGREGDQAGAGLTMFGVTTPCVQAVTKQLEADVRLPGLPRHRRRRPAMEKLVESGLMAGVIDVTTTEVADELVGGVCRPARPAGRDRAPRGCPTWLLGALDMVNFGAGKPCPSVKAAASTSTTRK